MAVKYFVHAGNQFTTIEVAPATIGITDSTEDRVTVTVLEDIVFNLTDTGAFTPILEGNDADFKMNTLRGYWETRQGGIQEVRRLVLRQTSPLVENTVQDIDNTRQSDPTYNIHTVANTWILPPGIDHVIPVPNNANRPQGGVRLTLIREFIYDHSNLAKFDTAPEAWQAFNNYFLTFGLTGEIISARNTYFVNPDLERAS